MARKLPRSFYRQGAATLAPALLGKRLVRMWRGKKLSGLILETEAYLGAKDRAAHTWQGRRTARVASMYLPGGHVYVYMIYGMHFCLNVVAGEAEVPEAVLIRAIEVPPGMKCATNGPGRLCKALHVDRRLDGADLGGETIFIEQTGLKLPKEVIGRGPRIGVEYAGEAASWPLRFYWRGNSHLSRKEQG